MKRQKVPKRWEESLYMTRVLDLLDLLGIGCIGDTPSRLSSPVLAPVQEGTIFAGLVGSSSGRVRPSGDTPPSHLNRRSLWLPSSSLMRLGLIQDKQLGSFFSGAE